MLHEPAVTLKEDKSSKAKSKLGIKLFFVYFIIYSGFVALAVTFPELLGVKVVFGLNLAITYGFGLILLAIVMGFIYHLACSRLEDKLNAEEDLS
jgi:uncharacterized membrane protein (DUF485 family)